MVNKCIIMGELASKKLIQTKTGKPMLMFTVRTWDAEQKSEFLDCVAYGRQAELIERDFPVKRNIYIECKAHSYKDKNGDLRIQFVLVEFKYLTKEVTNENYQTTA